MVHFGAAGGRLVHLWLFYYDCVGSVVQLGVLYGTIKGVANTSPLHIQRKPYPNISGVHFLKTQLVTYSLCTLGK